MGKQRKYRIFKKKEILKILNYLEKNKPIDMPTEREYYEKFISESGFNSTWSAVLHKVRAMSSYYMKVKIWLSSEEAKKLIANKGYKFVEEQVCQMCHYFNALDRIYGGSVQTETIDTEDSSSSVHSQPPNSDEMNKDEVEIAGLTSDNEEDAEFLMEPTPTAVNSIISARAVKEAVSPLVITQHIDVPELNLDTFLEAHVKHNAEKICEQAYAPQVPYQTEDVPMEGHTKVTQEKVHESKVNDALADLTVIKRHNDRMRLERKKLKMHKRIEKHKLRMEELNLELSINWQNKWMELKNAQQESRERLLKYELELKATRKQKDAAKIS